MEMAGHGDLLEYIRLRGSIPDRKAANMFLNIVDGVDYLHHHNIVHRYMLVPKLSPHVIIYLASVIHQGALTP